MTLNLTPTELLAFLDRCMKADLTFRQVVIITEMDEQELNSILVNNIRTHQRKKSSPASMPNSFYISCFKENLSVKQIAERLGCHWTGVYKILRTRGISALNYLEKEKEETK